MESDPPAGGGLETIEQLDAIERELRGLLGTNVLIGAALDLDLWGPQIEPALVVAVEMKPPRVVRQRWPACLVAYLVWQGLQETVRGTFWPTLSVAGLRNGVVVGPEFEAALHALSLPSFDELEALEGFRKETRDRRVRRIRLHGGLPHHSAATVIELMRASLEAGLRTADEMINEWVTLDLRRLLNNRPAERLIRYGGDFSVRILGDLLALWRAAHLGQSLESLGAPSHLVQAVRTAMVEPPPPAVQRGCRLWLDPLHFGGPSLTVPKARGVEWFVDEVSVAFSSVTTERHYLLGPPGRSAGWKVESLSDNQQTTLILPSLSSECFVGVFHQSGRIHRLGSTLTGYLAHVIAPHGTKANGTVEHNQLSGKWAGFDQITVDLRGIKNLRITPTIGEQLVVETDISLHVGLSGDVIEGVTTIAGSPVYGRRLELFFEGFVPPAREVCLTARSPGFRDLKMTLDRLPESEGLYDLTMLLDDHGTTALTIESPGETVELEVCRFASLQVDRPAYSRDDEDVTVTVRAADGEFQRSVHGPGMIAGA